MRLGEYLIQKGLIDEEQLKEIMAGKIPRPPRDWDENLSNKPPKVPPAEGAPSGPIGSPAGQH